MKIRLSNQNRQYLINAPKLENMSIFLDFYLSCFKKNRNYISTYLDVFRVLLVYDLRINDFFTVTKSAMHLVHINASVLEDTCTWEGLHARTM